MRRKKILLTLFCVACVQMCMAQNQHKVDSLLNVLKMAKEDTGKVNTLHALGIALRSSNPDTTILLANQALSLSEKTTSKKHIANSYHLIASAEFLKGNYTSSLENNFKALSLREELADKSGISKSLGNIGNVYKEQDDYPKALDYYFRALKIKEQLGDKAGIAIYLGNIGSVYSGEGDYPKALDYHFKSLKMEEELQNKKGIGESFTSIGFVYSYQSDYPKALDYYYKALKIEEELGDKFGISLNLTNIGTVNAEQGDYPKALDYYFKALKIEEELGGKPGMSILLGNIGKTYSAQKDYPKALDYFFRALKMTEELGDKRGIGFSLGGIGQVYTKTGNFAEAEAYLNKAIAVVDSTDDFEGLRLFENSLSQLYDTTGRYKLALAHYKKAMVLKDTLYSMEKDNQITRKEMTYEFDKMQAAEKAEHEKRLAVADVEIKKQKVLKYSFIGGLALTILLFFLGYRSYRTRQALRLQIIRNRIADDLHDDIGSTLNSISVYSEVAKQKSPAVVEELEQIGDASRKIIDAMSDIVWTINTKNDSFEQIILRLRSLTYNLLRAKNIEHTFRADESLNDLKLSMEERRSFYLIFKEAINNLVKYSEASRVSISLTQEGNYIILNIHDNGVGFDVKQESSGNGLLSMRSRAEEMKAELNIDSEPGNGTTVELKLRA